MAEVTNQKKRYPSWVLFLVIAVLVFIAGIFAASIMERRQESSARLTPVTNLKEWEPRNEVWGQNYPQEYESYLEMLDTTFRSKYGGSATIHYLDQTPELVILWAGYPFSEEYNQARGHPYAIHDIRAILRSGGEDSNIPATCWTCKSTDVPRMMAKIGPAAFYAKKWIDMGDQIVNPIGCQDCHDPKTMNLRISRPGLIEAMARRGRKIESFTHNEMRSLVCAQCHVEYYFRKSDHYLFFPWDKGFSADSMESYYDETKFFDFTHALSRVPILKAQHPDYEIYMTGVHAARGVSCADCHMPYRVEGGIKFTDHKIQSPLNNIANSCQVCHRESEEQLRNDVYSRQDKVTEVRKIVEKSLASAHIECKNAWDNGASVIEMAPVMDLIRSAQWRWDWCAASNSTGFHSPVVVLRTLATAIERAEKARGYLREIFVRHNIKTPIFYPNLTSAEKAQKFIGLDIKASIQHKEEFLRKVAYKWDSLARKRQGSLKGY
ncbi:MAG: ammonia-forming cytochrome c nitrite reductase subunit c552 [Chloroflexota bacterium]